MPHLGSMITKLKSDYIWHNGRFVKWDDAKVHISTWSLHYSGAMFEGIRAFPIGTGKNANSHIFRLSDHVQRFLRSAKIYEMSSRWNQRQIERIILDTVRKNKLKSCYIRPLMYFGSWQDPSASRKQHNVDMAVFAVQAREDLVAWEKKKGIRCIISSWRKPAPNALPADAKCSANYAVSYLGGLEAARGGYDYGILLDHRGFVAEALTSNIFAVIDGELITPPLYASILAGLTRDSVLQIARDQGIRTTERDMMPSELLKADEVFITGTAGDVTPVIDVDGAKIGSGKGGPVTGRLQKIYHSILLGKNKQYAHWLTKVY